MNNIEFRVCYIEEEKVEFLSQVIDCDTGKKYVDPELHVVMRAIRTSVF